MIAPLAAATTAASLLAGLIVAAMSTVGTYRRVRVIPSLAVVEVALIVQAIADSVGLWHGHRPAELPVHLAYLATSVLVLPVATSQAPDDDRWSGLLIGGALVVVAVLVVRMQATWHAV